MNASISAVSDQLHQIIKMKKTYKWVSQENGERQRVRSFALFSGVK